MFLKEVDGSFKITSVFIVGTLLVLLMISFVSSSSSIWDSIRAGITGKATSNTFNLNISVGNSPPNITAVYIGTSFSPLEYSQRMVTFYFTANDSNGYQNIDATSGKANFTFYNSTTTVLRANSSCLSLGNIDSKTLNFSCTVDLWYFDPQSTVWGVTAYVQDNSAAVGQNTTVNFTYQTLQAFVLQPPSLTFASLNPGDTNKTPNNGPLKMNNTGNYHYASNSANISVNATNLVGESNGAYALYANNFTVGNTTGGSPLIECGGAGSTFMSRAVYQNVSSAVLGYGNTSVGTGPGQTNLYNCLTLAGNELTSQAYSTNGPNSQGNWTVKVG